MVLISSVAEAYTVLDLEHGATIEQVKASYKQLALRTHPDKNPNNPEATAKFQQVSAAYNLLSKHLTRSHDASGPGWSHHSYHDHDDYSEDDYDYEYYEPEEEGMDFFMYLFEAAMGQQGMGIRVGRFPRPPSPEETEEEYEERMRYNREALQRDRERRARQEEERKAAAQQERERERKEAEIRQKAKAEQRRANAEAERKNAELKVRTMQAQAQALRSSIFAAARRGDADTVKNGVWEQGVDAAGGEAKHGHEEFVENVPNDPSETLLHIAASHGNLTLVEWLDAHNAEPDERNKAGLTAFHAAVQAGSVPIMEYFLQNHPPEDDDSIYSTEDISVVELAISSGKPDVLRLVLDSKLATKQEIADAWTSASKKDAKMLKTVPKMAQAKVWEEMQSILMYSGGFTPPPTPKTNFQDDRHKPSRNNSRLGADEISNSKTAGNAKQTPTPRPSPSPSQQKAPQKSGGKSTSPSLPNSHNGSSEAVNTSSNPNQKKTASRGGRGRGRASGRGRGGARTTPVTA